VTVTVRLSIYRLGSVMYYIEVDLMNNLDTLIASNYIVRFKPSRKEYLSIVDVHVLS